MERPQIIKYLDDENRNSLVKFYHVPFYIRSDTSWWTTQTKSANSSVLMPSPVSSQPETIYVKTVNASTR